MAADAIEGPLLLLKKLGGLILLVFGLLLTAANLSYGGPTALGFIGILSLIAGAVLLVLKIVRRNQRTQA